MMETLAESSIAPPLTSDGNASNLYANVHDEIFSSGSMTDSAQNTSESSSAAGEPGSSAPPPPPGPSGLASAPPPRTSRTPSAAQRPSRSSCPAAGTSRSSSSNRPPTPQGSMSTFVPETQVFNPPRSSSLTPIPSAAKASSTLKMANYSVVVLSV